MSIRQQGITLGSAPRVVTAGRWEGRQTAAGAVVYYDDPVVGRQMVVEVRRDEVLAMSVVREGLGALCLLGLPLVLAFCASLALEINRAMTSTLWLLYVGSPLFFVAALAYLGDRYFAPPRLRVVRRDRPPMLLPVELRPVFERLLPAEQAGEAQQGGAE